MSDLEMVSLCQKSKIDNFSFLYEKYIDEIYKFVYLKTYDKELTEDLTSQTFLKALDKIHTFKVTPDANFRAWLYRIAYNLVVDNYKQLKETIDLSEVLECGYSYDFAQDVDNKDKLKEVMDFFETLKPKHKEILIMRLWDDLSFKEISEITGESLDNCKKIVSRTLSNIPVSSLQIFILYLLSDTIQNHINIF